MFFSRKLRRAESSWCMSSGNAIFGAPTSLPSLSSFWASRKIYSRELLRTSWLVKPPKEAFLMWLEVRLMEALLFAVLQPWPSWAGCMNSIFLDWLTGFHIAKCNSEVSTEEQISSLIHATLFGLGVFSTLWTIILMGKFHFKSTCFIVRKTFKNTFCYTASRKREVWLTSLENLETATTPATPFQA